MHYNVSPNTAHEIHCTVPSSTHNALPLHNCALYTTVQHKALPPISLNSAKLSKTVYKAMNCAMGQFFTGMTWVPCSFKPGNVSKDYLILCDSQIAECKLYIVRGTVGYMMDLQPYVA